MLPFCYFCVTTSFFEQNNNTIMSVTLRSKKLKGGRLSLYLDIYQKGDRWYEFLDIYYHPTKDSTSFRQNQKKVADSIRIKRENELRFEAHGLIPSHKKDENFIKYFKNYIDTNENSGNRKFIGAYNKFKEFYKKDRLTFNQLNSRICQQFYDYLVNDKNLSGETPFDYFKRFRTVINIAIKDNIISKNPAKAVIVKKPKRKLNKKVLTKEEIQLLANTHCGNDEIKRAFLFACFTGFGQAEIEALTWSNIQNGKVWTEREKNGEQVINKLSTTALQLLGKRRKSQKHIFKLPSTTAINKCIKNWVKRAGIEKKITFYCGRHTFAVLLLKNKTNLKVVANLMGHTTTKHTEKYLNHIDDLSDQAIDSMQVLEL